MNRPTIHLTVLLVLLSALISTTIFASSLEGRILQAGNPVAGMEVRLLHPKLNNGVTKYTDHQGVFDFKHLPTLDGLTDIEYHWRGKLIYRDNIKIQGEERLADTNL